MLRKTLIRLAPASPMAIVLLSILAGACVTVGPNYQRLVGQNFRVMVMDRDRSMSGVRIKLASYDYAAVATPAVTTDAQGMAQFDGVAPGFYFVLAEHDAGIPGIASIEVVKDALSGLTISLGWPIRPPIRARTASGILHNLPDSRRLSVSLVDALSAHSVQRTQTDENGQFVFPNTALGLYFLILSGIDTPAAKGPIGDGIAFEVSKGAEEETPDIDLYWSDCGLEYAERSQCSHAELAVENLCGLVVDSSGAVIAKADVRLTDFRPKLTILKDAQTDEAGRFVTDGVENGRYQMFVRSPGFSSLQIPIYVRGSGTPEKCVRPVRVTLGVNSCSSATVVEVPSTAQPEAK